MIFVYVLYYFIKTIFYEDTLKRYLLFVLLTLCITFKICWKYGRTSVIILNHLYLTIYKKQDIVLNNMLEQTIMKYVVYVILQQNVPIS